LGGRRLHLEALIMSRSCYPGSEGADAQAKEWTCFNLWDRPLCFAVMSICRARLPPLVLCLVATVVGVYGQSTTEISEQSDRIFSKSFDSGSKLEVLKRKLPYLPPPPETNAAGNVRLFPKEKFQIDFLYSEGGSTQRVHTIVHYIGPFEPRCASWFLRLRCCADGSIDVCLVPPDRCEFAVDDRHLARSTGRCSGIKGTHLSRYSGNRRKSDQGRATPAFIRSVSRCVS